MRKGRPAELFMGTGVERGAVGGGAHDDTEESSKGMGLLGIGVGLVPKVWDIFLADPEEAFADEVQDDLDLFVAAKTHLADNFLHQHAFLITNYK